jgi:hypothetical protein
MSVYGLRDLFSIPSTEPQNQNWFWGTPTNLTDGYVRLHSREKSGRSVNPTA